MDREQFFQNFAKLKQTNSNSSSTAITESSGYYSPTFTSSQCSNGAPIDLYAGYGVYSWQVLYSIWVANQSTLTAQFTYNQALTGAPTTSLCVGPANIFIMRHAEKSLSKPNCSIDNNGVYRACQLIGYINQLAAAGTPISYIIVCNPCPYNTSDSSMRPVQTMSMASFMLNIPMMIYGGSQDYAPVIDALFSQDSSSPNPFNGLNVLMCWEHSSIQQLLLNIVETAGRLNRLAVTNPEPFDDTSPAYHFSDYFFYQINPCPNGNFQCPDSDTSSPYNVSSANPDLPAIIGPHSYTYPYWNNYNYDTVYTLSSGPDNDYRFSFNIAQQPCYTCYPNCDLHIGLYQPLNTKCVSSYKYYSSSDDLEDECQLPVAWAYTPDV
jgi:hypothetical protein